MGGIIVGNRTQLNRTQPPLDTKRGLNAVSETDGCLLEDKGYGTAAIYSNPQNRCVEPDYFNILLVN